MAGHYRCGSDVEGVAYVYNRTDTGGFVLLQRVTAGDKQNLAYFGWSLGLSRDARTLVVGARQHDQPGTNVAQVGAVYVFRWSDADSGFAETRRVMLSASAASTQLGTSVALSRDSTLVVAGTAKGTVAVIGV